MRASFIEGSGDGSSRRGHASGCSPGLPLAIALILVAGCTSSKAARSGDAGTGGDPGTSPGAAPGDGGSLAGIKPPPGDPGQTTTDGGGGAAVDGGAPTAGGLGALNVLTRGYDLRRSGANLAETILTPANVNPAQFGALFQLQVDDQVYAQPLYASGMSVKGAPHNVVFVATVNNSVFAFDADSGEQLWSRSFNGAGRPTDHGEVGQACGTYQDFSGHIGIVSTPVIDPATLTMYLVTRTVEAGQTVQRLRAIDIGTGADRQNGQETITATTQGSGDGAAGNQLTFNPTTQNQRMALALSQGTIYIGWASFCDTGPYHGWVMAYDATTLARVGAFAATPNGGEGGIWQAGAGPAFDAAGNLYLSTGNGSFDGVTEFGESVLKLAPRTLRLLDSFTPANWSSLNDSDLDLGSSGVTFLPGQELIVTGGKEGKLYVLDPGNLGKSAPGDAQILQAFAAVDPTARPGATHHIHNTSIAWNGPSGLNLYVAGENDYLRAYRFDPGSRTFAVPAIATGSVLPPQGMPGQILTLSANGSTPRTGIVWATAPRMGDANQSVVPGILRAYDAETLALLWESTSPMDDTLNFAKFNPPLVVAGKVYVASFSNMVSVYGLRPTPPPNLALNKDATGSVSCTANQAPAAAVNGSISGGLDDKFCSSTAPEFLLVDLGATATVARVIVRHAGTGGESVQYNTRSFKISLSTDGAAFTQVAAVTNNVASVSVHGFAPTAARYVRLDILQPTQNGDAAARIYELEVYGP